MRLILGTLLILFLSQVIAESLPERQLSFLNRLINFTAQARAIRTIIVLQNSKDKNCALQDWNSANIPILRSNEQTVIAMKANFNGHALALVCMDNDPDARLLIHLAKTLEGMRQARIVLWMQQKPREALFQLILKQVEEFKFIRILILQMGEYPPLIFRMDLHPSPHFVWFENLSSLQPKVFVPKYIDFMGRTASVDANFTRLASLDYLKIEGRTLFEFARQYNLTLKLRVGNLTNAGSCDIHLTPQFLSKNTLAEHTAPVNLFVSTSLAVMVPCGREKSLKEVFELLDVRAWLFYIFCVYALLVLVETFILVLTYRMSGRTYRATRINPFVNLRAFRAILGMSFPVSSRDTLSLRQLFLAMSIFGMVFSNFFSCKLSALLTKYSQHAQVMNFEELRASGLTVIVDPQVRSFIESELQADFFRRVVPLALSVPKRERATLLMSMNQSYGYIIFKENWPHINNYQISKGRKAFCVSPDLGIIDNIPITSVLQKDSIYEWPLSKTVILLQEAGISQHWRRNKYHEAIRAMNLEIPTCFRPRLVPLSLDHLKLLWYLLLLGHGTAVVVFILEVFLDQVRKRNRYTRNESVL